MSAETLAMNPVDELDSAARALGDAHRTAVLEPKKAQYIVRCVFCSKEHLSDYWDEIEAEIMHCRSQAPGWRRGDLAYWEMERMTESCGP